MNTTIADHTRVKISCFSPFLPLPIPTASHLSLFGFEPAPISAAPFGPDSPLLPILHFLYAFLRVGSCWQLGTACLASHTCLRASGVPHPPPPRKNRLAKPPLSRCFPTLPTFLWYFFLFPKSPSCCQNFACRCGTRIRCSSPSSSSPYLLSSGRQKGGAKKMRKYGKREADFRTRKAIGRRLPRLGMIPIATSWKSASVGKGGASGVNGRGSFFLPACLASPPQALAK